MRFMLRCQIRRLKYVLLYFILYEDIYDGKESDDFEIENPLYIIWEKEKFMIRALLMHNQETSEITFSLIK